jgi:hypothetical protein
MAFQSSDKVKRVKAKFDKNSGVEPTMGKASELQGELEALQHKYGKDLFQIEMYSGPDGLGQGQGGRANQYPVQLTESDPYDNVMALKAAAPTEMGQKTLMAEDLAWLRRKEEQKTAANFEVWKANLYNSKFSLPSC